MSLYDLHLYKPIAQGVDTFVRNLKPLVSDWRRSIRAIGGFWTGSFALRVEQVGQNVIENFYNTYIGYRVEEKSLGQVSWEGEIVSMDYTKGGVTYRTSLDHERWHNRVKVAYTDSTTAAATATAWSEDTDSSGLYGESGYIDVVGDNYDSTSATAARDRRLVRYAWPTSFPVGGLSTQEKREDISLSVIVAGYAFSMNRRFRESDTAAANASAQVSTLVGESEFVTAGKIDTNTLQVPISGSEISFRLWDGIQEIVEMGDGTNDWAGGVYAGRVFHYKQAESSVTHMWQRGRLLNLARRSVVPTLARADVVVQIMDAPQGTQPPGTTDIRYNSKNVYVEEIEFIAPNHLRMEFEE